MKPKEVVTVTREDLSYAFRGYLRELHMPELHKTEEMRQWLMFWSRVRHVAEIKEVK